MRRIAIINQKGGVGKTTTAVNLGAALARLGRRVLVVDMDPQANCSTNLGVELRSGAPSTYTVLLGANRVADAVRSTNTPGLFVLPAHLDLSGAELELAGAIGRETILRDALDDWVQEATSAEGVPPVDYVLLDNPPSLGLLSVNGLAAADEVLIAVQTEFFALQGLSKLVEVVQLLRRKLNPALEITGVLGCLYDNRLRLAREVLAELRAHFPEQSFKQTIGKSVKLAECPSFSQTIFEYAPESSGAKDHLRVGREVLAREGRDADLTARFGAGAGSATEESEPEEAPSVDGPDQPEEAAQPERAERALDPEGASVIEDKAVLVAAGRPKTAERATATTPVAPAPRAEYVVPAPELVPTPTSDATTSCEAADDADPHERRENAETAAAPDAVPDDAARADDEMATTGAAAVPMESDPPVEDAAHALNADDGSDERAPEGSLDAPVDANVADSASGAHLVHDMRGLEATEAHSEDEPVVELQAPAPTPKALPTRTHRDYIGEERAVMPSRLGPRGVGNRRDG